MRLINADKRVAEKAKETVSGTIDSVQEKGISGSVSDVIDAGKEEIENVTTSVKDTLDEVANTDLGLMNFIFYTETNFQSQTIKKKVL